MPTTPGNPGGDGGQIGPGSGCDKAGDTQTCCGGNGSMTCKQEGEFTLWSDCVDAHGKVVTCDVYVPGTCATDEFGHCIDGGQPNVPGTCADGEFANCDGGPSGGPPASRPSLCDNPTVNTEPEILAGYSPANGQKVALNGQIKVWITDECPAFVATGEQVDPTTGKVTQPGDLAGKANDGYLNEPALYIAPSTAESGGTPHFPQYVKGWYNNMPPAPGTSPHFGGCHLGTFGTQGPAVDTPPAGVQLSDRYDTEFIWDVSALGLAPGHYIAEFVIHDGDHDRAIGCVDIEVDPLQ